jgi:HEPN domain-containing protein
MVIATLPKANMLSITRMRSVIGRLGIALVLDLAILGAALPVAAEDPKPQIEEAQRRYRRARELYDESNYRAALVEMQRAYDLSANYRLLFDLGQIYYQLQEYPGSLNAFTKYLAAGKDEISAQQREEVQRDIERLIARIGTLRITTNKPGAEILVDDVPAGVSPLAEPVMVGAGRHKITATLQGQPTAQKLVDIAGADVLDVRLDFAPVAPAPTLGRPPHRPDAPAKKPITPPDDKQSSGGAVWVPWVLTGGFAAATVVTGVIALKGSGELTTLHSTKGSTRAQINDAQSSTKTMALVTDVLLGATLAGLATSIVLTATGRSSQSAPARVSVRLGPGSAAITGSF